MDAYFATFLADFGPPTSSHPATPEAVERYRGRLPDQLLTYWQQFGFCGFGHGLFWITNPADFAPALHVWLGDLPSTGDDALHVIARGAFGELLVWGTASGFRFEITSALGLIVQQDGSATRLAGAQADLALRRFFACRLPRAYDMKDRFGEPMFELALAQHGALQYDEVFAFQPALGDGGVARILNVVKRNVYAHLELLARLGQRRVVDDKSLPRKASR